MTDDQRKKILEKIRKLLALKESAEKIGSEGEAYAAARGVHRLLTEYNLSMADVLGSEGEDKGPKIEESDGISYKSHFGLWKQQLMGVICKYNYCKCVCSSASKRVYAVGTEANVAVCIWLFEYLVSAFVGLAKQNFRIFLNRYCLVGPNVPLSAARLKIGEKRTDEFFHSYYIGTVNGLRENFEAHQVSSDEKGLMVTFNKHIDEYLKQHGGVHQRRGTIDFGDNLNPYALDQGYNDGRDISLNRQVGSSPKSKKVER